MPYNYAVDSVVRASLSIQWHESVLLIDEAHNVVSPSWRARWGRLSNHAACCIA